MPSPALEHAFDAVISAAHRVLKPRGYAKRGACFRRGIDGNYVIVQFQKSAWNAHDCLKFTVNFGVLSSALAAREAQAPSKIFDAAKCHMTARIGNFRPSGEDLWWTLDGADPGTLISEALVLIESGAAHFEDVASDRALAGLWRTRKGILTADGRSVMRAALASLPDTSG